MWRDNEIGVNKVFKKEDKEANTPKQPQPSTTYPQVDYKQRDKICSIKSLNWFIHIPTPLIVVINFYI